MSRDLSPEKRVLLMNRLQARIRECFDCGSLGPAVMGKYEPTQNWMLVGQAPGTEEVKRGMPFIGPAGRRLFAWLKKAGFTEAQFRSKCYITAVYKCYPGKSGHGDLRPTGRQISKCIHLLDEEFILVRPKVLLLVGGMAIDHFLGDAKLVDVIGKQFKKVIAGISTTVIPLPHSSGASLWTFNPENHKLLEKAIGLIRRAASAE